MNVAFGIGPGRGLRTWILGLACVGLGVVLFLAIYGCRGQVVDEATGKPLEGVYVMAVWNGAVPGIEPFSRCYDFEITRTDQNGRYRLPRFSWDFRPWIWERHRFQDHYLAGYQVAPTVGPDQDAPKMRIAAGDVEARLRRMASSIFYMDCLSEADRKTKLAPLYRLQADEARKLAVTPSETEFVRSFEFEALLAEVGYEKLLETPTERSGK